MIKQRIDDDDRQGHHQQNWLCSGGYERIDQAGLQRVAEHDITAAIGTSMTSGSR